MFCSSMHVTSSIKKSIPTRLTRTQTQTFPKTVISSFRDDPHTWQKSIVKVRHN